MLIIEDDVDAAETLREALALCDHEVRVAHDGPEGLKAARKSRPDAVLCDIGLPSMTGYEVAAAMRADRALKKTFLIALSGWSLPEDGRKAIQAGFDQHLAKPPDLDLLEALVANLAAPKPTR
ncbi:MAG TPA: response regulator [Myxococcales bacterium]